MKLNCFGWAVSYDNAMTSDRKPSDHPKSDEANPSSAKAMDSGAAGESLSPLELADAAARGELDAAEQMARYEEALKESDWGHQPC